MADVDDHKCWFRTCKNAAVYVITFRGEKVRVCNPHKKQFSTSYEKQKR